MASTGRNTTFILLIMLSIVVFLFLNMVWVQFVYR